MNKHIVTAIESMCEDLCLCESVANRLMSKFLNGLSASVSGIKNNNDNFEEMKRAVHTLKGNSANMRLDTLYCICLNLEQAVIDNDSDKKQKFIGELDEEVKTLLSC